MTTKATRRLIASSRRAAFALHELSQIVAANDLDLSATLANIGDMLLEPADAATELLAYAPSRSDNLIWSHIHAEVQRRAGHDA